MCGILGTVDLPFDPPVLDLIRHRGPDDCGMASFTVGPHRIQFGHRRLSIVDLSAAGHQPMETTRGRHAITFNGEIYNHLELRGGIPYASFRGRSDTETALECLARFGVQRAAEFNGIFAFAFLDMDAGKLFLARDPFGIKPLYYWHAGSAIAFSSEMRAIRALVKTSVDLSSLAELLRLRYSPSPDTLLQGIRKVRPGHIVEIDLRRAEPPVREYSFTRPLQATDAPPFDNAVRTYGAVVESAVKRQLMSDVEVGVFLSGGVDSALVATLAQKHVPYRMKAFTVGYDEPDEADEIGEARETAAAAGLEHHEVRISRRDFFETLRSVVEIVEEPLATTSVIPMWHLSALAARHVKVVLSGQGADESLGGYRRYQLELFRQWMPGPLARMLGAMCRTLGTRNAVVLRTLDSADERDDVERFTRVYTVFSPGQIRRLIGCDDTRSEERVRYSFDLLDCRARRHAIERMMSLDLRMNLADDLLLYTDKITMSRSLECRVPLLDLDLVRYVEGLPYQYRVAPFRGKVIHKKFASTMLPAAVVSRKKKGFLSPTGKWFRSDGSVREILLERNSRLSTYFDRSALAGVVAEHEKGFDRQREIFLLLGLHYWFAAQN